MATMTLARVEEVIARHKRDLCDLYFQRNSLLPVFRLPTETLQIIFTCLARDFLDKSLGRWFCSGMPRWVNVSYVCRRWRVVALNCSTLWSYLFVVSPRWTEQLLTRSKQASLHVNVDLYRDTGSRASERFLKEVAKHAERIQELRLHLPRNKCRAIISLFLSSAPRLTNLSIKGEDDTVSPQSEWPPTLFNGDTPVLRKLNLVKFPVSWCSLKVTDLTTLRLCKVPHPSLQEDTADCLATLACMRNLTYLELYDVLSSAGGFLSSAAFDSFQKIHLPHLSRLWISAPISTLIALLHSLTIPLKTLVRLRCHSEPGLSLHDHAPLSALLAQRFAPSDAQAPSSSIVQARSLDVSFEHSSVMLTFNVLKRGYHFTASRESKTWDCNVPLKIEVLFDRSMRPYGSDWSDRDTSLIGDICCSLSLTDIWSLCVEGPPSTPAFWKKILGSFQGIRYLQLERGNMPDLAPLLTGKRAPALQRLKLCDIEFMRPSDRDESRFTDVQSLRDALSRRKGSRGRLIMQRCAVGGIGQLDMVGKWADGHFRVVEEHTELI